MATSIGRLGYVGLGIEATPGTAVAAAVYLPWTENSLRGHHEPMEIISSKSSRLMDTNSTSGKKWSEGDVTINLDVVNPGYLFRMALGQELYTAGTPSNHTFFVTVSGNTPTTATLINNRDTDTEQYTYASINDLTIEVPNDGLATVKASFMGKFPTVTSSTTPTTTSGTVVDFIQSNLYFGTDITTAEAASATAVNGFTLNISNNLETMYQTGSGDITAIKTKGFRAKGSYKLYFSATTDRDAHYNLNKRAMSLISTGNVNEQLRIRISRFRLQENEISTGLDDFFVVNGDWVAEDFVDASTGTRLMDIRLQNAKAAAYYP